MRKQSIEERIVVMRVLNRYAAHHGDEDWNKPVVAALEKWIGKKFKQVSSYGIAPDVNASYGRQ